MFQTLSNVTAGTIDSKVSVAGNLSEPVISEATYRQIRFVLNVYVSFIIFIVGLATNVINCLVFQRQGLAERMTLCLFYLAAVDLCYLASASVSSLITVFYELGVGGVGDEHYLKNIVYVTGVMYAFKGTSSCFNVVISLERCVCVILPLRATTCMKTLTMGIVLTFIAFIVHLGYVAIPLKYDLISRPAGNTVLWQLAPSKIWLKNQLFIDTILDKFLGIGLPITSFITVSMATSITVIKLRMAAMWRENTSSSSAANQSRQLALTRMLITVSCAYIVSMVPFVMIFLTRLFVEDFSLNERNANLYLLCSMIVNLFPLAHGSVNLFIYLWRSSRYRRELQTLLCHTYQNF